MNVKVAIKAWAIACPGCVGASIVYGLISIVLCIIFLNLKELPGNICKELGCTEKELDEAVGYDEVDDSKLGDAWTSSLECAASRIGDQNGVEIEHDEDWISTSVSHTYYRLIYDGQTYKESIHGGFGAHVLEALAEEFPAVRDALGFTGCECNGKFLLCKTCRIAEVLECPHTGGSS